MRLDGVEKDSAPYKEVQKRQRQYKNLTENFLKIKTEFDEIGAAIIEKQKMYIENAKKAGSQKKGRDKSAATAASG